MAVDLQRAIKSKRRDTTERRAAPPRTARERSRLKRSFADFVTWAWPLVTGAPFVGNAITDKIVAALQRVADGTTTRLLIACPPGVGKSTLLACYSAWRLAREPAHKSIHGSHAFDLAATESRRVRRLVEGDDYRRMFPAVQIRADENTVGHWATAADGRYYAIGVGGALTGRRGHEAIVDDALNAVDRFSKAARDACYTWFLEALSTRLDGDLAPMIVVMQRLDPDDLIGRLIEAGGWELVECPAELDDGTLCAPNVLPREKLDALRAQSESTYATQYLQRPSDDSSAAIKRTWWRFHRPAHVAANAPRPSGCDASVPAVPTPDRFERIVIACDLTFGGQKQSNDLAAILAWGMHRGARYLLAAWWRRGTQLQQHAAIKSMKSDFPTAKIVVEKAAAGAGVLELLAADGIDAIGIAPVGSKAERLDLVSPAIESGSCYLPLGTSWLAAFVEELAGATKHDDAQDATALALSELATSSRAVPQLVKDAMRDREKREDRAAAIARGEMSESDAGPDEGHRLMHKFLGVPLPGKPRQTCARCFDVPDSHVHKIMKAGHACTRCGDMTRHDCYLVDGRCTDVAGHAAWLASKKHR
ncbi:MAG TPA: hypothetical protein VGL61_31800 [Kofleriaceae bacterium]|jgi:predicted phage terminase large subunit-like protein